MAKERIYLLTRVTLVVVVMFETTVTEIVLFIYPWAENLRECVPGLRLEIA